MLVAFEVLPLSLTVLCEHSLGYIHKSQTLLVKGNSLHKAHSHCANVEAKADFFSSFGVYSVILFGYRLIFLTFEWCE